MTVSAVFISTVVSCLASYSIARLPLRGAMFWRLLFVGGLIVPVQLIMLAIFIIMRWIGLLGSLGSLILVYSTFGIPLGVLVLVGFFQALPKELTRRPDRRRQPTSRSSGGSCCRSPRPPS